MSITSVKFLKEQGWVKLYLARTKPYGKVRDYGNNLVLGSFKDVISNSDHIVFGDWMVVH